MTLSDRRTLIRGCPLLHLDNLSETLFISILYTDSVFHRSASFIFRSRTLLHAFRGVVERPCTLGGSTIDGFALLQSSSSVDLTDVLRYSVIQLVTFLSNARKMLLGTILCSTALLSTRLSTAFRATNSVPLTAYISE